MSESTHPMFTNGSKFGAYRIEEFIADGGMAEIYRAVEVDTGQIVALKVISPRLASDKHYQERFREEAAAVRKVRHANVVPIYESGEEQGTLFLAMRFIDPGGYPRADLRAVLDAEGLLPWPTVRWILGQVADALDHTHRNDLVHRDVTPSNILIERGTGRLEDARVYLTDFGITRLVDSRSSTTRTTGSGGFVGTLRYMAPERLRRGPATPASDTYALGCVAFELLTGRSPYGDIEEEGPLILAILDDPVPTLAVARTWQPYGARMAEIPQAVETAIAAALAKVPENRPPGVVEFVAALDGEVAVEPAGAVAAAPVGDRGPTGRRVGGRRVPGWALRRRVIVPAAVVAVLAAAALTSHPWWPDRSTRYDGARREAPVALTYPPGWHEYDQPGVSVLFSPLDVHGVFSGRPEAWQDVTRALDADPASAAGVYVRAINATGGDTLDTPGALKREVGQDITTGQEVVTGQRPPASRLDWDEQTQDVTVGGHPARQLGGYLRAPNSTYALRLRALVIRLDSAGRTVHVILFGPGTPADPAAYDDLLQTFRDIQASLTFAG
ncbi:MAG TPA: serine/threonine-protein kinase [Mycobacteriales bacterium]|nr:serine/threonine-protein kinase [Mycobacteriales bacterium]